MSSRAHKLAKLAKRVQLKQLSANAPLHGCEECRCIEFRGQLTRQLIAKGLIVEPTRLNCPACGATWLVKFGGDATGHATVSWKPAVLS